MDGSAEPAGFDLGLNSPITPGWLDPGEFLDRINDEPPHRRALIIARPAGEDAVDELDQRQDLL